MFSSRLKRIPETVYLIDCVGFGTGAFGCQSLAGFEFQRFYEFGATERSPGSIVSANGFHLVDGVSVG